MEEFRSAVHDKISRMYGAGVADTIASASEHGDADPVGEAFETEGQADRAQIDEVLEGASMEIRSELPKLDAIGVAAFAESERLDDEDEEDDEEEEDED